MFGSMTHAAQETLPVKSADFRHVHNWIFDLDNTLYPADSEVFAQIEARMTRFVADYLQLEKTEARRIQKKLYRDYGTTLSGLIQLHGVDPEAFLSFVHDIDLTGLRPDKSLAAAIARLPGRRIVFTNGSRQHARRILAALEISHLFDAVWDIRTVGFVPKPTPAAYDSVIAQSGIVPRQSAMFEDLAGNLAAPHALGMTTVWLNNGSRWSKDGPAAKLPPHAYVDHEITALVPFLHAIRI
jgi:putative hydrolase of the HAD superfamily